MYYIVIINNIIIVYSCNFNLERWFSIFINQYQQTILKLKFSFPAWVLGWLMCKTVPYVQGVSVAASVYSLIAVSVDR